MLLREIIKDTLGQPHSRRGHRNAMGADFRGRSHFLGDRKGALEHLVQVGP